MANHQKYNLVSLFSGAGGFDWGFSLTGRFNTILACEKLVEPARTFAHNFRMETIKAGVSEEVICGNNPTIIQGDIQQVDFSKVSLTPDVLIGGPPCQDFSITISRKGASRPGLNGGRGKLYVEFVRAVMFFQPKIFVFENVPGLLSANEHQAFNVILNDLQHLEDARREAINSRAVLDVPSAPVTNYKILFKDVIYASNLGVPQTRKRLIIIGIRLDLFEGLGDEAQSYILNDLEESLSGETSLLARFPLTCMEVFEGQPLSELQEKYRSVMSAYQEIINNPLLLHVDEWRNRFWNQLTLNDIRRDYFFVNQIDDTPANLADYKDAMQHHRELLEEMGWLGRPVCGIEAKDGTNCIPCVSTAVADRMSMIPPDENYTFVNGTPWAVEGKDISFIYRRSAPLKPAWTVMAYGGGGTYGYHYERGRSQLTLREKARIQTFTDDFVFNKPGVRAQIGEAVPPLLGKRIAESLIPILELISN